MARQVVIVGGGTAGWLTAAYLGRTLAAANPAGVRITLIESPDIPTLGVGEGTFPNLQRTLKRIGIDEAEFIRESRATLKQGVRFDDWAKPPGAEGRSSYFHPFHSALGGVGMDLLPYWLLGVAGEEVGWDEASTVQKAVSDAARAPKQAADAAYDGPLTYAYHFDAASFAALLRSKAIALGVHRLADTVDRVNLDESGAIASLTTRGHGEIAGDLFIDCTGFRAQLIGEALGSPFTSCRRWLFADRAMGLQAPYPRPDAPLASCTIATAKPAGWTWDIGLLERRGVGYVYSSDHTDEAAAEAILRAHVGDPKGELALRTFRFEAGYRPAPWVRNCVAIGLAGGFFEPLEATGIVLIEVAAVLLSRLFPWAGELETAARQFNTVMEARYIRALDFLKLHYCLTKRRDTAFWRDNTEEASIPERLQDLLGRWRWRPPEPIDFDMNLDTFSEASWQYVLYGMGFRTDLSAKAALYERGEEARRGFAEIRRQAARASSILPDHRALVERVCQSGFLPPRAQGFR